MGSSLAAEALRFCKIELRPNSDPARTCKWIAFAFRMHFGFTMQKTGRKLLTTSLVALYGAVALLGYGLHELAPAHLHHHVECHAHAHAGCIHSHGHAPIQVTPGISDSHECDVCVFLDQIQSERPQFHTQIVWQPTVADVAAAAPRIVSQAVPGLHAPRGPPT